MLPGEYKSFFKQVSGNEGEKCRYNARLDTYGCGCGHNCDYCYARSLLSFRGFWNPEDPKVADIEKIRKKIKKLPKDMIVRLGGMTDCFQACESQHHITYETICELNRQRIGYLIVTKSDLIAEPEYLNILNPKLAHIQITVTCLDDRKAVTYEKASISSRRVEAIRKLQDMGYDVAIRLSPIIDEYMDYDQLNSLGINRCVIEFLRVNTWIKRWMKDLDFTKYTFWQSGYLHLPLQEKIKIIEKIKIKELTVCEDVTEHYQYWMNNVNANKNDCCNLQIMHK